MPGRSCGANHAIQPTIVQAQPLPGTFARSAFGSCATSGLDRRRHDHNARTFRACTFLRAHPGGECAGHARRRALVNVADIEQRLQRRQQLQPLRRLHLVGRHRSTRRPCLPVVLRTIGSISAPGSQRDALLVGTAGTFLCSNQFASPGCRDRPAASGCLGLPHFTLRIADQPSMAPSTCVPSSSSKHRRMWDMIASTQRMLASELAAQPLALRWRRAPSRR